MQLRLNDADARFCELLQWGGTTDCILTSMAALQGRVQEARKEGLRMTALFEFCSALLVREFGSTLSNFLFVLTCTLGPTGVLARG